jgi:hypothetical protein
VTAVVVIEALVIALLTVLVVGLLKSHAEILRALHDLGVNLDDDRRGDRTFRLREPAGTGPGNPPAPPDLVGSARPIDVPSTLGTAHDIAGRTPAGEAAVVGVVGSSDPVLVAFLSSGCLTCQEFWSAFADGVDLDLDGRAVRIVAVTKGEGVEDPEVVARLAPPDLTTVMSDDAYDDYAVPVAPYFVLVEAHSGQIAGEGAAATWPQLASLLGRAVADAAGGRRTRRELLGGTARRRVGPERHRAPSRRDP